MKYLFEVLLLVLCKAAAGGVLLGDKSSCGVHTKTLDPRVLVCERLATSTISALSSGS